MNENLEKAIEKYRKSAVSHGEATNIGDHKRANKQHDLLMKALAMIRKNGLDGSKALLYLVEDEDTAVKCWAATHSLKYDEAKSKSVLRELSTQIGPMAFNAKMVLSEWEKGTLEIP